MFIEVEVFAWFKIEKLSVTENKESLFYVTVLCVTGINSSKCSGTRISLTVPIFFLQENCLATHVKKHSKFQ